MTSGFEKNVNVIFKKHELDNEKLESVIKELFEDFETYLVHESKLVDSVKESLERDKKMNDAFK